MKQNHFNCRQLLQVAVFSLIVIFLMDAGAAIKPVLAASNETSITSETDLTTLSIEELMQIDVTVDSVSKKPQMLFNVPAAVYVITSEDIRRSGATNIPDLLRYVPGVNVARINVNKWAISARGFNGRFASKLLVLIDGRNVYSPLFSGVYWDTQDTLIEDIERIEVIRGPGGSVWGTNAVNGVINIITKNSGDTHGTLATAGFGKEERAFGSLRYGDQIRSDWHYRLYAKVFDREEGKAADPDLSDNRWKSMRIGFRSDLSPSSQDDFLFQGDFYHHHADEMLYLPLLTPPFSNTLLDDFKSAGGFFLSRWRHRASKDSDSVVQFYYDYTDRKNQRLNEIRHTLDIDFNHRFAAGKLHEIIWGAGLRYTADEMEDTYFFSFDPKHSELWMPSAFIQDTIMLSPELLSLNIGLKIEDNAYTGMEYQPSSQLLLTPTDKHTFWASISRVVRTPDRIERDSIHNPLVIPGTPPRQLRVFGTDEIDSEEMISYECGYRSRYFDGLTFDIAVFYAEYDKLRTFESDTAFLENTPSPPHMVLPIHIGNKMDGKTSGIELASDIQLTSKWRVRATYTYLDMKLSLHDDSNDTRSQSAEGYVPHSQCSIRSFYDLTDTVNIDFGVRFVDDLPELGVEKYWALDAHLSWALSDALELSLNAQNLDDQNRLEWSEDRDNRVPTEVERCIYGKLTWNF